MKTLLTRKTIIIAMASVLIALVTIFSVNVLGNSGPVTGFANIVTTPVRALASNVARMFESIYASIYRYESLNASYQELLQTFAEREHATADAFELLEENRRLREQLGFRERHPGYETEMAGLLNWGSDNWSSSFVIDIGYANSIIKPGFAVATEEGVLIGQVLEVSAYDSIVITMLDTKFSAGARVGDSRGIATVKGDFMFMRSGLMVLDHIGDDMIVLPGAMVSTSGQGVFPSGLIVGRIVEVYRHSSGISRYATVRPLLEIDTISTVFVITDFEIVVTDTEQTDQ